MKTRTIIVILLCIVGLLIIREAYAQYTIQINIRSSAVIRSQVGVYWDLDCTQPVTSMAWGPFDPGGDQTQIVYLRNTSPATMTLNMTTRNWSPQGAGDHVSMSWDREGFELKPNQTVEVRLTLEVSVDVRDITEFSFELCIFASEKI